MLVSAVDLYLIVMVLMVVVPSDPVPGASLVVRRIPPQMVDLASDAVHEVIYMVLHDKSGPEVLEHIAEALYVEPLNYEKCFEAESYMARFLSEEDRMARLRQGEIHIFDLVGRSLYTYRQANFDTQNIESRLT